MDNAIAPVPIEKPDIVVPDAGPLIHLAAAGLLHLLHEVGAAVVIVDMVAQEITRDPAKPGAETLRAWLAEGRAPGSNRPVPAPRLKPAVLDLDRSIARLLSTG